MFDLDKEKLRIKEILDKMSIDEFDNMLIKCGINEIKSPYRKCYHKNIIVAHNSVEKVTSINCIVRCRDCDETLFQSFNQNVKDAYNYIQNNKSHFDTLIDLTCDNLNGLLDIEDGSLYLQE